jgi:Aldos-2-ulose dehydratase, beta-propeller domain/FG-GAP-like repeat/FG-GAP repeat
LVRGFHDEASCIGSNPTRREFLRKAVETGVVLTGAASRTILGTEGKMRSSIGQKPPRWVAHPVGKIPAGYQVAVADVTGDGRPDILALSSEQSIVQWYENPTWKMRPVTTKTQKNISLAPLAWKGYKHHGMALASDFYLDESSRGGKLWWAEPTDSPESEWSLTPIASIPTSHRLRWGDLDGDGRPELVDVPILGAGAKAPDYNVGAPLTWFRIPERIWNGAANPEVSWDGHLIDASLTVVHGALIYDWDGDGRDEILTASFEGIHLFRSRGQGEDLSWTKVRLASGDQQSAPQRGSSEIGVGNLGGRRFLATIEPWHGDQVVVYFEPEGEGLWSRHVIDASFKDGHALVCADLDGDGTSEIVAGYRGPGTSLYVFYPRDASGKNWERRILDNKMAASGVVIADMNGDGRPDIVAIGASTGEVKWYENVG